MTEEGDGYKTTSKVIVATGSGADGEEPEVKSSVEIKAEMYDEAGHGYVDGHASIEVKNGDGQTAKIDGFEIKTEDQDGQYASINNGGSLNLKGITDSLSVELGLDTSGSGEPTLWFDMDDGEELSSVELKFPKESGTLARAEDVPTQTAVLSGTYIDGSSF